MGPVTREPAVSVIVPVYNTLPYLLECLDSLVGQTVAADMEVIAVDDGSTDGSGAVLDEYAARHPGLFTVVHQPNSGGPAAPCNRGLERARGRFVYFLGADDRLALDAMEGLLGAAEEWNSDIVFGRMVGVNGRYVWQGIFAETNPDLDLYGSLLPFSISNSKLFRRSLIEEHGLRFPEDLRIGSDQPFTIEAMVRARKISVLADRDYLYVMRRDNATNISFSAHASDRLHFVTRIMAFVADLLEPGPRRDALLTRHFRWELSRLFGALFPELDPDARVELCGELATLCDTYLTPRIVAALPTGTRVRLELARRGDVARLLHTIELLESGAPVPLATDGRHLYQVLPGLEDGDRLPAELYRTAPVTLYGTERAIEVRRLRWHRPAPDAPADAVPELVVRVLPPLHLLGEDTPPARLVVVDADGAELGAWPAEVTEDGGRLRLHARVPAPELAACAQPKAHSLRMRLDLADGPVDVLLPLEKKLRPVDLGPIRISVRPNATGRAMVRARPFEAGVED